MKPVRIMAFHEIDPVDEAVKAGEFQKMDPTDSKSPGKISSQKPSPRHHVFATLALHCSVREPKKYHPHMVNGRGAFLLDEVEGLNTVQWSMSLITESSDFGLKPTDRKSTKDCLVVQVNSSSHWSIDPFPTGDAGIHCPGTLVGGIRLRVLLLACRPGRLDGYRKNILEGPRRWASPDCWGSWTVNPVLTSMLVPF